MEGHVERKKEINRGVGFGYGLVTNVSNYLHFQQDIIKTVVKSSLKQKTLQDQEN